MSKDWRAYALHIRDAIVRLRHIQQRGDLRKDQVLYDAALRNLQTLSEATQRLPEVQKSSFPHIPWSAISGFRNVLVHNYWGEIDALTVAHVMEQQLGPLDEAIALMLADEHTDAQPPHFP